MPVLSGDGYRPGRIMRNADAGTIIPSLLRRVPASPFVRERLGLPDGDFLDLDHLRAGHGRTAVLVHGLEGSSDRPYMRGMARALLAAGWNITAVNLRACSGEPNRTGRFYHNGATDDLHAVLATVGDPLVALVGFSLGGNLVLNLLGEDPAAVPPAVRAAVAVSAPVDLASTAELLLRPRNRIYHDRFLRKLRDKVRAKAARYPELCDPGPLRHVRHIVDFDDLFTAPLHGFADAADYYARCSPLPRLPDIAVPTLVLTAENDPLLGPESRPFAAAGSSPHLHLEVTRWGGHTGFRLPGGTYHSEQRAAAFLAAACNGAAAATA